MTVNSRRSVFVAMYAAIICVGCFIAVPVGAIPIVLQNMLAVMAGALFGLPQGAAAVGLFLAAGALGVPVFSGGKGGFAVLAGPTGGFLIGYFIGALVCGLIAGHPAADEKPFTVKNIVKLSLAGLAGFAVVYVPGILQFMHVTSKPLATALAACVVPFLPGDAVKLIIMVPLAAKLRPVAARFMNPDAE